MKDILIILIVIIFLVSCSDANQKGGTISREDTLSLDVWLDSMTTEGEYCLIRGSDREYDTIIDHVRYKYVQEEGYDAPVKRKE